ncbi:MAG: glycosyltransferase [Bdellovibrionales bacterium]|nr:glycosyltransferase [Bdellovibrionales bacterium]
MNVAVVIPIYNAFEDALRCLESILKFTPTDIPIFIVDDRSSDGCFESWLETRLPNIPNSWIFLKNERNSGFSWTVNRGLRESAPRDVVIVNSDTVLTARWLEKLHQAAYSAPDIGSVTPFTNNGAICSIPRMSEDNEIPEGFTLDTFAAFVEELSEPRYPEMPTCVGFCTYLRRDALEQTGLFDEVRFPRGYGEENDLSCRMVKCGFRNILADNTFVFHKGAASFGPSQQKLMEQGEVELRKIHPSYYQKVSRYCRNNPLEPIQHAIQDALLRSRHQDGGRRILHVLHNGLYKQRRDQLGGTEFHVQGLVEQLPSYHHWSLVRGRSGLVLEAHSADCSASFHLPKEIATDEEKALSFVLNKDFFDLVHVHHTRWFDLPSLVRALKRHGNYLVSLHDFVSICPRFHLFTVAGEHCSGQECRKACGYRESFIAEYRRFGLELLSAAKEVVSFSENTVEYLSRILGEEIATRRVQHGIKVQFERVSVSREERTFSEGEGLRIITYAPRGRHKGRELFQELFAMRKLSSGTPIQWIVLGEGEDSYPSHVEQLGSYSSENFQAQVLKAEPDIGLLLSLCPETYGLSFDELLACSVPLVVGPLGAPAERIMHWNAGWVLPELSVAAVIHQLEVLNEQRRDVRAKSEAAGIAPVRPLKEESEEFQFLYDGLMPLEAAQLSYDQFVAQFEAGEPRRPARLEIIGRGIEGSLSVLESLGLRSTLQAFLQSALGEKSVKVLKNLRG